MNANIDKTIKANDFSYLWYDEINHLPLLFVKIEQKASDDG